MGEAFIVRKGGVAAGQTAQPTITFVSSTTTSITFTLTNNDASTAVILWEVGDTTPDANSIELAASATSSNLTVSGLTEGDIVTIYATANATGQIKSNVAELERGTTLATPTIAEVSTTDSSITFTVRNESNTAASVTYGLTSPPTTTTLELAANTTSASQTISGLDGDTSYTVFAEATKTNYTNSTIASLAIETDVPIIYTAATGGTTAEYDDGGKRYKSHTFTSDGTFTVTTVGDATDDRNKVDYLIIAGGGGGGGNQSLLGGSLAGGGGAGGYRTTVGTSGRGSAARSKVVVTAQGYTIDVGSGGAAGSGSGSNGSQGQASSALGVTTVGGGFGAGAGGGINRNGGNGGSGGGGHRLGNGGNGTTDEGFNGINSDGIFGKSAGGAGAGSQPSGIEQNVGSNNNFFPSGSGLSNLIRTGSNETRGVGGDSGFFNINVTPADNGAANTGNGGKGANRGVSTAATGGTGGSGIVVIRYEIATV